MENNEGNTISAGIYRMCYKRRNVRVYEGQRNWTDENILIKKSKSIWLAARSKGVGLQPLAY
jgi:hypothetical protein